MKREWTLDLTKAGKIAPLSSRPAFAQRQHIVTFDGQVEDVERFSLWLTFPDDETMSEEPASQAQYDSVASYYGEGPAHRVQAGYMISAWYFADVIRSARYFKFTAPRRGLIHAATAAYILGHPEHRRKVRDWSQYQWREPTKAVGIERVTASGPPSSSPRIWSRTCRLLARRFSDRIDHAPRISH